MCWPLLMVLKFPKPPTDKTTMQYMPLIQCKECQSYATQYILDMTDCIDHQDLPKTKLQWLLLAIKAEV